MTTKKQAIIIASLMLCILLSDCDHIQVKISTDERDGRWLGTTSYGDRVTFEVEDNRITSYEVGINSLRCRVQGLGDFHLDPKNDLNRVVNDQFKIKTEVSDENILHVKSSYVFEGTFLTDKSALGTFRFKMSPNCQVPEESDITWIAENQN